MRLVWVVPPLLSLACTQANPAFQLGGDGSSGSTGDSASTLETGESSSSNAGTSDSTGTDSGTSDSTDTSDTGVEPCTHELGGELVLAVQTPTLECPLQLGNVAISLPLGQFNLSTPGMAAGSFCESADCSVCSDVVDAAIGAPDYLPLIDTWAALAGLLEQDGLDSACIELAANTPLGMVDDKCLYGALGLFDHTIEHGPLFVGQLDGSPPSWIADQVLQEQPPVRQPIGECSCASLFDGGEDQLCCTDSDVVPTFYALQMPGFVLQPGPPAEVEIEGIAWTAELLYAHDVATCSNVSASTKQAWALTRTP